jgi:hypothetical protein
MSVDLGRKLEREGRDVLAIPVGVGKNDFVLTKLGELRKLPGHIIRDGEIEEWRIEGAFRHEGRLYLHGPHLGGLFLEEAIQKSFPAALPYLTRLAHALVALKARSLSLEFIQTDSIYFLEEGGILFLPPALMKELRNMHPEVYKLLVFESISHPDIEEPEKGLSFSLAALLYRVIRGHYPFQAETEEEIHNRIRYARLLPLSLVEPGFREDLSRQIMAGLGRRDAPPPSLKEWEEILSGCKREGLHRDITETEREQILARARKEEEKIGKAYRGKVFWQRHWKTVGIAAVAVVVVGALAGSLLKNILAPRQTRGFGPERVVETFYRSMNDLNHTLMEDCVVEGAGKQTIREVINIYVLSRVSLGYEGTSHVIGADEWDAQGRPELSPPQTVYGVTDLAVRQERGEPEPVFQVSYTKWVPEPGQDPGADSEGSTDSLDTGGPGFMSLEISERVYLKLARKDWVIYRFEPL